MKKEPSFCKALQARNRGIRLAASGIRWHQAIMACNVNGESHYTARVEILRKLLASLQKLSPSSTRSWPAPRPEVDPTQAQTLEALTERSQQACPGSLRFLANGSTGTGQSRSAGQRPRRTHRSPSGDPRAERRRSDRTAEISADPRSAAGGPGRLAFARSPADGLRASPQCIARIAVQAELEQAAARLIDPAANLDARPFKISNAATLRRDCERFGKQFVAFQASLHDALGREAKGSPSAGPTDPQAVARLDRILRWADARDIKDVNFLPPPPIELPPPTVTVHLVRKEPKQENSSPSSPWYGLTVSVSGATASEAEFFWECDKPDLAAALEVRPSSAPEHLLSPGAWSEWPWSTTRARST